MNARPQENQPLPNGLETTPAQRIRADWRTAFSRISYGAIVKNIPFYAFIALLGVVYISYNTTAVERQREIEKQQTILKELRWHHMDAQTRLMSVGVEAEVIRRAAGLGLKPLMLPAYTIPKTDGTKKDSLNPAKTVTP